MRGSPLLTWSANALECGSWKPTKNKVSARIADVRANLCMFSTNELRNNSHFEGESGTE